MKILQINVRYNYGSTGKLTADIHNALVEKGYQSVVLYGRKDKTDDKNVRRMCGETYAKLNNLRSRIDGFVYGGCYFSTKKIIARIKKEKPDIVHLQCINGYFVNIYNLVNWLKNNNIKTVLTLHAEFMYTANCGYSLDCNRWQQGCGRCPQLKRATKSFFADRTAQSFSKMKAAFDGFDSNLVVISVSDWLKERAHQSPIFENKNHKIIYNGVDIQVFRNCGSEVRKKLAADNEKIVFHATSMFSDNPEHIKGGSYIIKLAERLKDKNVKFVVAGKTDISGEIPPNIILLGEINNQKELAEYYSAADVTVIASKKETFSMICAESLCCGTPIAGFKAGAPEQISISEYSSFAEYGDIEALECAVHSWLCKTVDKSEISEKAHRIYSKEHMISEYCRTYQEMIHEN